MDAVALHVTKAVSDAARALRRGRCSDRVSCRRPCRGRLVLAGRRAAPAPVLARGGRVRRRASTAASTSAPRLGEPVRAPAAGVVSFVGPVPSGGRALTIQTADGYAVTLLQLGSVAVARGSSVAEGAVVGQVGESEDAVTTAPHVHLGVRVAAEPNGYVDPVLLLPARAGARPRPRRRRRRSPLAVPAVAADEAPAVAAVEPVPPAVPDAGGACRAAAERVAEEAAAAGSRAAGLDCSLGGHRAPRTSPCGASARRSPARRRCDAPTQLRPAAAAAPRARSRGAPPTPVAPARVPPSRRRRARSRERSGLRDLARPAVSSARPRDAIRPASPATRDPAPVAGGRRELPWYLLVGAAVAAGIAALVARRAAPIIDGDELLPDDTDLLRELDAAHRPRVHDDRRPTSSCAITGSGASETFFLTGVDEHATRLRASPRSRGSRPRSTSTRSSSPGRSCPSASTRRSTSSSGRPMTGTRRFVQDFLQRIYDNGDVYQDVYAGLYCVGCEAFKTEDELVDGKCPDHGTVPEWIEEKNWFFRLSAYQDRLLELYDERPDFVLPGFRSNEARSFIAGGLRDFSISRATQTWGIPIPWDPDQVAYVWADALVNYLSALSYAPGADLALLAGAAPAGEGHPPLPLRLLAGVAALGRLRAAEAAVRARLPQPRRPQDLEVARQRARPARPGRRVRRRPGPVLGRTRRPRSARTATSRSDSFRERYERELANDLGNLLSRTTAMIARYRDGDLAPAPDDERRARGRRERARTTTSRPPSTAATSPERSRRSGTTSAVSTATWSRRSRGSSRRIPTAPASSTARSTSSPTACGSPRSRSAAYLPETVGADPRGARPAGRRRLGATSRTAAPTRSPGSRPAQPLFPRIDDARHGGVA